MKSSFRKAVYRNVQQLALLLRRRNEVTRVIPDPTHDNTDSQPDDRLGPTDAQSGMVAALEQVRKHKTEHPTEQLAVQMQRLGAKSSADQ